MLTRFVRTTTIVLRIQWLSPALQPHDGEKAHTVHIRSWHEQQTRRPPCAHTFTHNAHMVQTRCTLTHTAHQLPHGPQTVQGPHTLHSRPSYGARMVQTRSRHGTRCKNGASGDTRDNHGANTARHRSDTVHVRFAHGPHTAHTRSRYGAGTVLMCSRSQATYVYIISCTVHTRSTHIVLTVPRTTTG